MVEQCIVSMVWPAGRSPQQAATECAGSLRAQSPTRRCVFCLYWYLNSPTKMVSVVGFIEFEAGYHDNYPPVVRRGNRKSSI